MIKGRQEIGLEGDTDYLVRSFLEEINVIYSEQGTNIKVIDKALIGASKSESGKGKGKPEFIFVSGNHLFVIENKKSNEKLELLENGLVDTSYPARNEYAVNGAVHYAKHIVEKAIGYNEVVAIGITGNSHYYQIQPYYVTNNDIRRLDSLKSFEDFSEDNLIEYWRVAINGELPKEERDLLTVKEIAATLHEDLRNYGNLEGERKATVVSAILLALEEPTFSVSDLKGFDVDGQRDGDKIFGAIETYLRRINFHERYEKYGVLMDSFNFFKTDTVLNTYKAILDKTPLKYYTEQLETDLVDLMKSENDIDILGNFYGEFVKYGGNDGNPLGIVLTPRHITSLMTELIDVRPHDYVLDPACGSGAFLISAMMRMLSLAESEEQKQEIKQNHLYGIELQGKLFTIATTNMILRGDGKSNLIKGDMFHVTDDSLQGNKITKVLINPPYSQAKTKDLVHLSEISFINRALEMMKPEGKLAAIVPQSTMVGKTKEEKQLKKQILENNILEAVITLNTDTFSPVGVHPCICIFKAGVPHNLNRNLVKFIDFSDDGYFLRKHVGLVGNGTQDSKREHLIDVINGNADDSTKFIVRTTITAEDEWLHAFYYFNEEIPPEDNFKKAIADYLTFQFDMYSHGRGYLFKEGENDE
ncbi:class I SAM-dependent DNA methyltransferase [Paenibacillus sp. FSL H3-0286]|uniref:HsdM family class I SAM-dependent methyltransferase n=1 Tax=Paenibacillus sp. FSL H3-0286 TaxID=2921427 RepID=UPI0032568265